MGPEGRLTMALDTLDVSATRILLCETIGLVERYYDSYDRTRQEDVLVLIQQNIDCLNEYIQAANNPHTTQP